LTRRQYTGIPAIGGCETPDCCEHRQAARPYHGATETSPSHLSGADDYAAERESFRLSFHEALRRGHVEPWAGAYWTADRAPNIVNDLEADDPAAMCSLCRLTDRATCVALPLHQPHASRMMRWHCMLHPNLSDHWILKNILIGNRLCADSRYRSSDTDLFATLRVCSVTCCFSWGQVVTPFDRDLRGNRKSRSIENAAGAGLKPQP
jgi:hypothetical protein